MSEIAECDRNTVIFDIISNEQMKQLFLAILAVLLVGCDAESTDYEFVNVALPVVQSKADFRASVRIQPAEEIQQTGKIYAYQNLIFVNDEGRGVHIIDNSNPSAPIKTQFIKIPLNYDVAIKDDILYADSGTDLVLFDISVIQSISEVGRINDVFENEARTPDGAAYVDASQVDFQNEIIVDYTIVQRQEEVSNDGFELSDTASAGGGTGQAGSLARFLVYNNYLYTLEFNRLTTFDISNTTAPVQTAQEYDGWNMETLFISENYLYIGTQNGLIVYNLDMPAQPVRVGEAQHYSIGAKFTSDVPHLEIW